MFPVMNKVIQVSTEDEWRRKQINKKKYFCGPIFLLEWKNVLFHFGKNCFSDAENLSVT